MENKKQNNESILQTLDTSQEGDLGHGKIELHELKAAIEADMFDEDHELLQLKEELEREHYGFLAQSFIEQVLYEKHAIKLGVSDLSGKKKQRVIALAHYIETTFQNFPKVNGSDPSLDHMVEDATQEGIVLQKVINQKMVRLEKKLHNRGFFKRIGNYVANVFSKKSYGSLTIAYSLSEADQEKLKGKAEKLYNELFVGTTITDSQGNTELVPGLLKQYADTVTLREKLIELDTINRWTTDNQERIDYYSNASDREQQSFIAQLPSKYKGSYIQNFNQDLVDTIELQRETLSQDDIISPLLYGTQKASLDTMEKQVNSYNQVVSQRNNTELFEQFYTGGIVNKSTITREEWNELFPKHTIGFEVGLGEVLVPDNPEMERKRKSTAKISVGGMNDMVVDTSNVSELLDTPLEEGEVLCISESNKKFQKDELGVVILQPENIVITRKTNSYDVEWKNCYTTDVGTNEWTKVSAQDSIERQALDTAMIEQQYNSPTVTNYMRVAMLLNNWLEPLATLTSEKVEDSMIESIKSKVLGIEAMSTDLMRVGYEMKLFIEQYEKMNISAVGGRAQNELSGLIAGMKKMQALIYPENGSNFKSTPLYRSLDSIKEVRANTVKDWVMKTGLPMFAAIAAASAVLVATGGTASASAGLLGRLVTTTAGRAMISTATGMGSYRVTKVALGTLNPNWKEKTDFEKALEGSISGEELINGLTKEFMLGSAFTFGVIKVGAVLGKVVEAKPNRQVSKFIKKHHPNFKHQLNNAKSESFTQRFFKQYKRELPQETGQEVKEGAAGEISPALGLVVSLCHTLSPGKTPFRLAKNGNQVSIHFEAIKDTLQNKNKLLENGYTLNDEGKYILQLDGMEFSVSLGDVLVQKDTQIQRTNIESIETHIEEITAILEQGESIDNAILTETESTLHELLQGNRDSVFQSGLFDVTATKLYTMAGMLQKKYNQGELKLASLAAAPILTQLITEGVFDLSTGAGQGSVLMGAMLGAYLDPSDPKFVEAVDNSKSLDQLLASIETANFPMGKETVHDLMDQLTQMIRSGKYSDINLYYSTAWLFKTSNKKSIKKLLDIAKDHVSKTKGELSKEGKTIARQAKSRSQRTGTHRHRSLDISQNTELLNTLATLKLSKQEIKNLLKEGNETALFVHLGKIFEATGGDHEAFVSILEEGYAGPRHIMRTTNLFEKASRMGGRGLNALVDWFGHRTGLGLGLSLSTVAIGFHIEHRIEKGILENSEDLGQLADNLQKMHTTLDNISANADLNSLEALKDMQQVIKEASELKDDAGLFGDILDIVSDGKLEKIDEKLDIANQTLSTSLDGLTSQTQEYESIINTLKSVLDDRTYELLNQLEQICVNGIPQNAELFFDRMQGAGLIGLVVSGVVFGTLKERSGRIDYARIKAKLKRGIIIGLLISVLYGGITGLPVKDGKPLFEISGDKFTESLKNINGALYKAINELGKNLSEEDTEFD